MNLLEVCAQYEKYAIFDETHNWGGITGYYKQRAKELLSMLSGGMREDNKLPLLERALISAFELGQSKGIGKTAAEPLGPDRGFGFHENGEPKGEWDDEHDAVRERSKQRYKALREAYDEAKRNFCGGLKHIATLQYTDDRKTIQECVDEVQRHCANTLMVVKDLERPDWDTMTHNDR